MKMFASAMGTVYRESFMKENFCDMLIVTVLERKHSRIVHNAKSPELFEEKYT